MLEYEALKNCRTLEILGLLDGRFPTHIEYTKTISLCFLELYFVQFVRYCLLQKFKKESFDN